MLSFLLMARFTVNLRGFVNMLNRFAWEQLADRLIVGQVDRSLAVFLVSI
jgi:hypothetical protein